jgi:hypothetical protein
MKYFVYPPNIGILYESSAQFEIQLRCVPAYNEIALAEHIVKSAGTSSFPFINHPLKSG